MSQWLQTRRPARRCVDGSGPATCSRRCRADFDRGLLMCQEAGAKVVDRRGRSRCKNEQANTLRLAPSLPKHKREGRANFLRSIGVPAGRINACARMRARCATSCRARGAQDCGETSRVTLQYVHCSHDCREGTRARQSASPFARGQSLDLQRRPRPARCRWRSRPRVEQRRRPHLAANRTGALPGEIAQQLAADYDVSNDRTGGDVAAFIAALAARGLVVEDPRS